MVDCETDVRLYISLFFKLVLLLTNIKSILLKLITSLSHHDLPSHNDENKQQDDDQLPSHNLPPSQNDDKMVELVEEINQINISKICDEIFRF